MTKNIACFLPRHLRRITGGRVVNLYDKIAVRKELKSLIGHNCEPTQDLERLLLSAYARGRSDVFQELGIDESDLSSDYDKVAWTA